MMVTEVVIMILGRHRSVLFIAECIQQQGIGHILLFRYTVVCVLIWCKTKFID